jgi:hypothetical protein
MLHLEGTTLNFNDVNSMSMRIGHIEFPFNTESSQFDLNETCVISGFRRDVTA